MAVVTDLIEGLTVSESDGHVEKLTRSFMVTGLIHTNTNALWQALTTSGIPQQGDYALSHTNLICTHRKVKILPNSPTKAQVDCEYHPISSSRATFIFSGGTELGSVTTQKDKFGNQIAVAHTWPADDPDYPSATQQQGGDLSLLMPQTTLRATGRVAVQWPVHFARWWTGTMNATSWASGDPYQWICSRVDFQAVDVGIGRARVFEFTLEFQLVETGWLPLTFFIDPRTGKPPKDLVEGVGIKNVDWYGIADFNYLFPGA